MSVHGDSAGRIPIHRRESLEIGNDSFPDLSCPLYFPGLRQGGGFTELLPESLQLAMFRNASGQSVVSLRTREAAGSRHSCSPAALTAALTAALIPVLTGALTALLSAALTAVLSGFGGSC